ncbi:dermonecrotic toxin domain-containing protein [Pseudomonas parafulva]|uniref:dermonecrotic toxin domain-containing protein n=1 Tax=Pseudomonas parafulva TaxID=157782 RepID=UPI000413E269|nr:DUF6543 domain-containing protein [Pseudomonas parafulva]
MSLFHMQGERQLPAWAQHTNPEQWAALQKSQLAPWQHSDWFNNASPDLREVVNASHRRLLMAQAALARSLRGVKQVVEFAQPALQTYLARQGLQAPLEHCELLRVERRWHWVGLRYLFSHRRDSLLQAALQNFADDETFTPPSALALSADIQVTPIRVRGSAIIGMQTPAAHFMLDSERYQVQPLPLAPETFAAHCREQDLGGAYQAHLQHSFGQPQIRVLMAEVFRARLRLAAGVAHMRHLLTGDSVDTVTRLLAGGPVQCWQLALFGVTLHEVMLIDLGRDGLGLFLPNHTPALRQCNDLQAVHEALAALLLEPDARSAFTAYVVRDARGHFLDVLQQNLDATGVSTQNATWQRAADADLRPTRQRIQTEPFGFGYDQQLARMKHEARLLAVPTADADASARARRFQEWEAIGLDLLNVAGFFIPVVGTAMMAVTACQLLGEAFEGYEAWEAGDRHQALQHLENLGVNLALLGGLGAAGHALPKLFNGPLMANLQEIRTADGTYKLWNQDLAPYRSPVKLPAGLQANPQGQYLHEGRYFFRMDGHLYEHQLDPQTQQWRIIHPETPEAWQPPLEHNRQGAWRGQHEQPGDWSLTTLVHRLGEPLTGLTAEQVEQACNLCGVDAEHLRRVHLLGQPAPALLMDVLERMQIEDDVQALGADAQPGLFDQRYNSLSANDLACEALLAAYPRLSPALARRLLKPLEPAEWAAWEQAQTLPAAIRQQVADVHSELPLVRGLEGVLLPARASADSERLLFSALDALPAWPADLRLELRAGGPQGPVLDAVGSGHATTLARVIKSTEGYEAYLGERPAPMPQGLDLCRAIEQALPRSLHARLGIKQGNPHALRQTVLAWAREHRADLLRRLGGVPRQPAVPQGWLRGGRPLDPLPPAPRQTHSLAAAFRRIYPEATDAEIADWLSEDQEEDDLDDIRSTSERLRALQEQLVALRTELAEWARPNPLRPHQRHLAIQPLINAWRRMTRLPLEGGGRLLSLDLSKLDLQHDDLASMPLGEGFAHIEHLSLSGNRSLKHLPTVFCQHFPNLTRLLLTDCRFDHLPLVTHPEALRWLDLDSNRVTWDDLCQQTFQRYTGLTVLDLTDNPLLRAPDLRLHPELKTLFLSGCALTDLPRGLEQMIEPFVLDLSDNQLAQLPEGFELPTHIADTLRLESEWLSAPVVAQIEAYNASHHVDLMVCESDYLDFFDGTGPAESAVWQRLPLQYRRDLRALLDTEPFLSHPQQSHAEFWRRLTLIDTHPALREQWLGRPAIDLFNLPL